MRVDLSLDSVWQALPTQKKCLDVIAEATPNDDYVMTVDYTGALGSGKSWYLCRAMIGLCLGYPGIKTLLGRFNYTDLRDTTQATFFQLISELEDALRAQCPPGTEIELGKWEGGSDTFAWANGSTTKFRPLERAEIKYKSLDIAAYGADEADQVTPEAVNMLSARCRQRGYPRVALFANNPTSRRHWIYEWFVDQRRPHHHIFRTNTTENLAHLPPGYIEDLRSRFDPLWVRAYLDGEWTEMGLERAIFPTFDRRLHVAKEPLKWYKTRPIYVGIDLGYGAPGVVWAQMDGDNRLCLLRAWGPQQIYTHRLCEGIRQRNGEWFKGGDFHYYSGPDSNMHRAEAKDTNAQIFRQYGMPLRYRFTPIERGFNIIRQLLDKRDDGLAGLLVDPTPDPHLERLIKAFDGAYVYKAEKDDPIQDPRYTPLMDAVRYIVVNTHSLSGEPSTVGLPKAGRWYAFRPIKAAAHA